MQEAEKLGKMKGRFKKGIPDRCSLFSENDPNIPFQSSSKRFQLLISKRPKL